jgi:hypothetical protein
MRLHISAIAYPLAVVAVACGGSDAGPSYADLSAQAREFEIQATALEIDTPCAADANCSALVFTGACADVYAPLSLSSPNADRAVALANEQRRLIEAAMRAFPPSVSCPPPPDRPAALCVQAQCTLR